MKYYRIVLTTIFTLFLLQGQTQIESGRDGFALLDGISKSLSKLGDYRVSFSVNMGEESVVGSYVVSGDEYYMELATAEIYCDGEVKYEVNNRDMEIIVDNTDLTSPNVLNNPTRGFDFLDSQFKSTVTGERGGEIAIRLDPKTDETLVFGHIVVTINSKSGLPTSILYDMDGDSVRVVIESITSSSAPKRFERREYKKYEWIDFR